MSQKDLEILIFVLFGTVFLLALIGIIMFLSFRYQKKKMEHKTEVFQMQSQFQREILETQLEVQNATLQHVGQELHDNIGQLISLTKIHAHSLEESSLDDDQMESIQEIEKLLGETLQEVRQLTKSLDGDFVKEFGFISSLNHELQRIAKTKKLQTHLHAPVGTIKLGYQAELVLFRIMQEIFQNTLKHARAKNIWVRIEKEKTWTLRIQDDGKGFNLAESILDLSESGAGLRNIKRRAELIGFTAEWESAPGKGTIIHLAQQNETHL